MHVLLASINPWESGPLYVVPLEQTFFRYGSHITSSYEHEDGHTTHLTNYLLQFVLNDALQKIVRLDA